jgi:hypothetical protein
MEHMFQRDNSARRDRLSGRLAELERMLADPKPAVIAQVRRELARLAKG